jgi:hypothetical protein
VILNQIIDAHYNFDWEQSKLLRKESDTNRIPCLMHIDRNGKIILKQNDIRPGNQESVIKIRLLKTGE